MERGHTMIKAIVIGLGLVIVGLTIVLIFGIIDKTGDKVGEALVAGDAEDFADVAVALPAGATVSAMTLEDGALSLLIDLPSGAQAIMTVDRATGQVLGTLELLPRSE
jgi:hypothetical protein